MNKPTKKTNSYNSDAIKALIKKYGYSKRYITMCLTGDREGIMADNIIKDYKSIVKSIEQAIEDKIQPQE